MRLDVDIQWETCQAIAAPCHVNMNKSVGHHVHRVVVNDRVLCRSRHVTVHKSFVLSLFIAWQLYGVENLKAPRLRATVSMLRSATKGTLPA